MDLREVVEGITVKQRWATMNNEKVKLLFEHVKIPVSSPLGAEGEGFRYILDGMNAERIFIAARCVGGGLFLIERATHRAKERVVLGRKIRQNRGDRFPVARAYANIEAADLTTRKAAALFDGGERCGAKVNMAKLLAEDARWEAANVAVQTFGEYGMDAEYDVERKLRETRLHQVAPIPTNLIPSYAAEHVLGLPRSF